MKERAKKFAEKICLEHHELTLTRDDARTSANITVKYLLKQNAELAKMPEASDELKKHCTETKSFLKSVNSFINQWDPYL